MSDSHSIYKMAKWKPSNLYSIDNLELYDQQSDHHKELAWAVAQPTYRWSCPRTIIICSQTIPRDNHPAIVQQTCPFMRIAQNQCFGNEDKAAPQLDVSSLMGILFLIGTDRTPQNFFLDDGATICVIEFDILMITTFERRDSADGKQLPITTCLHKGLGCWTFTPTI